MQWNEDYIAGSADYPEAVLDLSTGLIVIPSTATEGDDD
jgi:hypothetical protein